MSNFRCQVGAIILPVQKYLFNKEKSNVTLGFLPNFAKMCAHSFQISENFHSFSGRTSKISNNSLLRQVYEKLRPCFVLNFKKARPKCSKHPNIQITPLLNVEEGTGKI